MIGGLDDDDNVKEGEKNSTRMYPFAYICTSIYYKCGGIFAKPLEIYTYIHTYQSSQIMVVIEDKQKGLSFKFC